MKPTIRRDGVKRFTVGVQFHISAEDLAAILTYQNEVFGREASTRGGVLSLMRGFLYTTAMDKLGEWLCDEPETAKAREAARAIVAKLFPDLGGAEQHE